MFFKESEQLRREHPGLEALIGRIDARLAQFSADGRATPAVFSAFLNVDQHQVASLFDRYAALGVLAPAEMCECTECFHPMPASDYRTSLALGQECPCSSCGTDLVQQSPRHFKAFRLTESAAHQVRKNSTAPKAQVEHLVLLIHGINTDGRWQEKVAAELNVLPGVQAETIGYGVLQVVMFWCPLLTRRFPIRTIEWKLRQAMAIHRAPHVSVVAHSFGTYAIFWLLKRKPDLRFFRMILCGSIVSDQYRWDEVQPRIESPIINDCGTRDAWPAAAKALTWGYGATGVFGFKSPAIRDRFHDVGHSGFFDDDFVQKYWVPFIERGQIVTSPWTSRRPQSPWHVMFLAKVPIQWIALGVGAWWYWGWIKSLLRQLLD